MAFVIEHLLLEQVMLALKSYGRFSLLLGRVEGNMGSNEAVNDCPGPYIHRTSVLKMVGHRHKGTFLAS